MELTKELETYMEEHKAGVALREVPDCLLFEMLAKATECEVGEKKGTAAFQEYFNLDMSYSSAYKEPEARGYKRVWVKGDAMFSTDDGSRIEKHEIVPTEMFTVEEYCKLMLGKDKQKETAKLYVKAYPETLELLKELVALYPRGAKGRMEACILADALRKVEAKYRSSAEVISEL